MSLTTTVQSRLRREEFRMENQVAYVLRPVATFDEIMMMKVDEGLAYIYERFPESQHKETIRSERFWNWWRSLWLKNDVAFLAELRRLNFPASSVDYYLDFQRIRFRKRHINKNLR